MNVCLDIGGTFIKWGIFDGDSPLSFGKEPTQKKSLLPQIFEILEKSADGCSHIGISTAGQVSPVDGSIIFATDNLPNWTGTKLRELIKKRFRTPCIVENDVNAVALGEFRYGAYRGLRDFICVAFGTGIGGAIFSNGELVRSRGSAGEFGHIIIESGGRACNCGNRGCYEQYASAAALYRDAERELGDKFSRARAGVEWLFENDDPEVARIVERYIDYVSIGLVGLVHALNPQAVVLGGAISENQKMISLVRASLLKRVMPSFAAGLEVMPASLGNNAALYGVLR